MIKSQFGVGELVRAAKLSYLRAAIQEVIPYGSRVNISRLAVVTGLTRKEVAVLLGRQSRKKPKRGARKALEQRALRVLRGWRIDPRFHNAPGRPAELKLHGDERTFSRLVRTYGGDVTPTSVLRELERMQVVSTARLGRVRLRVRGIQARRDIAQQFTEFAGLVRDFAHTTSQVANSRMPSIFFGFRDLTVPSPQEVALFQRTFARRAAALLESVNQWESGRALGRRKGARQVTRTRVGIGVYLTQEDSDVAAHRSKRTGGS
jgi:hypothetical protein